MDHNTRVDLFLSFHGSERLNADFDTRQLVRTTFDAINDKARDRGGFPSIFFDEDGASGRLADDIFGAIMQTRGGGIALCLLTPGYFSRLWCVTELRALFAMKQQDPTIELRLVYLCENADQILKDASVKQLVPELSSFSLRPSTINPSSSLQEAAYELSCLVWKVWDGNTGSSSMIPPRVLGKTKELSFLFMQGGFYNEDVSNLCSFFGINQRPETDIRQVFTAARSMKRIGYTDMESLEAAITNGNSSHASQQRQLVQSYKGKWIHSKKFDWSNTQIDMLRKIQERTNQDMTRIPENRVIAVPSTDSSNNRVLKTGGNEKEYVVQNGDTLNSISSRIYHVNKDVLKDEQSIFPGRKILIPSAQESTQEEPSAHSSVHSSRTYRIKEGDTLWKISLQEYGYPTMWKQIHEANRNVIPNAHMIYPGTIIVLPGVTENPNK